MYIERNILQDNIMDLLLRKLKAFLKLINRLERAEMRALQHFCLRKNLLGMQTYNGLVYIAEL